MAQRAVVNGELFNRTFGPAISPPTNSATSNAAANKLPPIIEKKPTLELWSHYPLLLDNSRYLKRFLPSFLFRRPDAGIDRRSCGASIGAKKAEALEVGDLG